MKLFLMSLILGVVHPFDIRSGSYSSRWLKSQHQGGSSSSLYCVASIMPMDILSTKVREYMNARSDEDAMNSLIVRNATIITKYVREKKKENPLEFVKPSGWFKDEFANELNSRTDASQPKVPHPLSNIELKKYGYGELTESVIFYGGPYKVGEDIGIGWVEPDLPKDIWAEELRPVREVSYNLDITGNLKLGAAFEDRLSLAEDLDLGIVRGI